MAYKSSPRRQDVRVRRAKPTAAKSAKLPKKAAELPARSRKTARRGQGRS
jgi:hypothetical protein